MKKLLLGLLTCALIVGLSACSSAPKNVEGTLDEIMDKVYDGIKEEELPAMIMRTELSSENAQWYIGTTEIDYEEGLASESGIGSIPHSVVLLRMKDGADVEAAKEKIKSSIDPRKWICVGVEEDEVIVESIGNLILVVLDGIDHAATLQANFEKLQ